MVRSNRSTSPYASRRRSGAGPIAAGTALFAVVAGALFYALSGDDAAEYAGPPRTADAAAAPAAVDHRPPFADALQSPEIVPDEADVTAPVGSPVADAGFDPAEGTGSEPADESLAGRIQAHLAAGEFGPALELAERASEEDQAELLREVADAQMEAGDFEAARVSIRRMPASEGRTQAFRERAARAATAGGGMMADFESLKQLIMKVTDAEWEEEDGVGGDMMEFESGVRVDPHGLLVHLTREERTGRLRQLGLEARTADLNDDMARPSALRLVSLTRLEREVARRLESGEPVLETMRHLAGLSQVRFVFVYPEDGEIVVGGPAEGWRYEESGVPVGVESGRPTLQLDDFVTVYRTFSPSGTNIFQCLIVPRQAGLRELKAYVDQSNSRGPLRPGSVGHWARVLQQKLGEQDAVFQGVPPESRVARVILEADYRMKLIGIGKLHGPPEIPSFFDLLSPADVRQNPPQLDAMRWWLTMNYEAVLHSPEREVFEVQGSSVLCQAANEMVDSQGNRLQTGQADPANRMFAANFTRHFDKLAAQDLVFADMHNIFDLGLVAALLRHEQAQERTGWTGGAFASGGAYQPAEYEPVRTVPSVVNHRVYGGKDIIVQVAGGVRGDLAAVMRDESVYRQADRLANLASRGQAPNLPEGRWWWDAAE